jgi:hypothetical protein
VLKKIDWEVGKQIVTGTRGCDFAGMTRRSKFPGRSQKERLAIDPHPLVLIGGS